MTRDDFAKVPIGKPPHVLQSVQKRDSCRALQVRGRSDKGESRNPSDVRLGCAVKGIVGKMGMGRRRGGDGEEKGIGDAVHAET
jgi:hypothetical protein